MTWVTFKKDVWRDGSVVYREGYMADLSERAARIHVADDEAILGRHEFQSETKIAPDDKGEGNSLKAVRKIRRR